MGIKNYHGKDPTPGSFTRLSLTQTSIPYSSTTFFHQQVRRKGIFHAHVADPDLWPKGSDIDALWSRFIWLLISKPLAWHKGQSREHKMHWYRRGPRDFQKRLGKRESVALPLIIFITMLDFKTAAQEKKQQGKALSPLKSTGILLLTSVGQNLTFSYV